MGIKKIYQKVVAPRFTGASANSNIVRVATAAELQAAVTAQKANQIIEVEPGTYTLTDIITVPLAATGGVLKALGPVSITGSASKDEAFLINPAVATASFEYTFQGFDDVKGGANKIGLKIANTTITKKVLVYLKQANFHDNGTGVAISAVNTDGSNAIRIYGDGPAEVDTISFTTKDGGDRLYLTGFNIDTEVAIGTADCTFEIKLIGCQIPVTKITGGHANNIGNFINCWVMSNNAAILPVAATDAPGALAPTIYPAS